MAALADGVIAARRGLTPGNVVRVVARRAAQLARALQKALRSPQAIRRVRHFKILVRARRTVKVQPEISQRLPRHIIERSASQPRNCMGQRTAGRFQMALQAHFHLPVGTKSSRIDDGGANLVARGAGSTSQCHVACSGPMTPLAIDAFRKRSTISRLRPALALRCRNARVGVVAEHALVVDRTRRALVIQPVIAWVHRPVTAVFRVPSERQLLERIARRQVQKGARVVARAEDIIDLLLFDVGVSAVKPDLPSPLIEFPGTFDGFEIRVRCLMEVRSALHGLRQILRHRTIERPGHSSLRERGGDALVATRANGRVDITVWGALCCRRRARGALRRRAHHQHRGYRQEAM